MEYKEELNALRIRLKELPGEITAKSTDILKDQNSVNKLNKEIKRLEIDMKYNISREEVTTKGKDDKPKIIAKFSNEKAREYEFYKRRNNSTRHTELRLQHENLMIVIKNNEILLKGLEYEFKAIGYQIRVLDLVTRTI